MNYDVLEESRHAIKNLEENAFVNHKEQYTDTLAEIEAFNERIDAQELKIKEAKDQATIDEAQQELTNIIDDIIEFNDNFNTSMIPVDDTNPLMVQEEKKIEEDIIDEPPIEDATIPNLDTEAIDQFLNNIG